MASQPLQATTSRAKATAKRKQPFDSDPATSKRPPLPLPSPESTRSTLVPASTPTRPSSGDRQDVPGSRGPVPGQPPLTSPLQPLVTNRNSNIGEGGGSEPERNELAELRKANVKLREAEYQAVKAQKLAERALAEAQDTIEALNEAEQERLLTQGREPIEQPRIFKDQAADIRLTSPRTLLGLDLRAEDKSQGRLTPMGMLKDRSWKLLLAMSREVITYGIHFLEVSESPDWRPLDREVKHTLVEEFEAKIKKVPCLKTLLFYSDPWDQEAELHVWRYSWPLKEMIKDTMDNIKDTNRNHNKLEDWCQNALLENPGPDEIGPDDWPPPRASSLLTAIQHARSVNEAAIDSDSDGSGT